MNVHNTKYPDNILGEIGLEVNEATVKDLEKALDELGEDKRRLIEMRYKYRMSYIEIGNVIECSKQTARNRAEHIILELLDRRNKVRFGKGVKR